MDKVGTKGSPNVQHVDNRHHIPTLSLASYATTLGDLPTQIIPNKI